MNTSMNYMYTCMYNLLDYVQVARTEITQISIIRCRTILSNTQRRVTSMIPTILVI
jgi:hypothetical protein